MDGLLRRETRYIEFEEDNRILDAMKIGMLALDCHDLQHEGVYFFVYPNYSRC